MEEKIKELKNDFSELLNKIDLKSYNPTSSEFQKTLNIGLLWYLLKKMDKVQDDVFQDEYAEAKDEIMGADKYYNMYKETKDPTLKSMASQEMNHAHYWISKIRLSDKTAKQKNAYDELLKWYNSMLEEINK